MISAPTTSPRSGGAQALAQHLREHPDAVASPPHDLARQFALEPEFVIEVLKEIESKPAPPAARTTLSLDPLRRAVSLLRAAFHSLTRQPLTFIVVTAIAGIGLFVAASGFDVVRRGAELSLDLRFNLGMFLAFAGTTLALHMLCYYRHGQTLIALRGAVVSWVVASLAAMVLVWMSSPPSQHPHLSQGLLLISFSLLMMSAFYAALGIGASVLGSYYRMRKRDRLAESLSRQELLARLFEIQARLKAGPNDAPSEPGLVEKWEARFQEHPYVYTFLFSLILNTATVVVLSYLRAEVVPQPGGSGREPLAVAGQTLAALLGLAAMCFIAYLGRGFLRAVALLLVFMAGSWATWLLPLSYSRQSWALMTDPRSGAAIAAVLANLLMTFLMAIIGTLGWRVQERAMRDRRLNRDDPATLVAEIVRIQWRLSAGSNDVCVVVVDAAKSSEMKASNDPLEAEYSFREYQRLLESTAVDNGGRVHSTAGDGAVLAFESCAAAFQAAREIQTEIARFNTTVNRMSMPFRLRIGLHMGPVAGDLSKVEFTEVIDIAAHVQAAAPVGGILLTESVAASLPGEQLVPLPETVDGHAVRLAYNPTVVE